MPFQKNLLRLTGALVWEGYATGSNCVGVKIVTKNYPKVCTESDPENSNGDYYYADDDDDRDIFNPPPSVSTTPFPTSMSVMVPTSERHYCAAASTKVIIQASQV